MLLLAAVALLLTSLPSYEARKILQNPMTRNQDQVPPTFVPVPKTLSQKALAGDQINVSSLLGGLDSAPHVPVPPSAFSTQSRHLHSQFSNESNKESSTSFYAAWCLSCFSTQSEHSYHPTFNYNESQPCSIARHTTDESSASLCQHCSIAAEESSASLCQHCYIAAKESSTSLCV